MIEDDFLSLVFANADRVAGQLLAFDAPAVGRVEAGLSLGGREERALDRELASDEPLLLGVEVAAVRVHNAWGVRAAFEDRDEPKVLGVFEGLRRLGRRGVVAAASGLGGPVAQAFEHSGRTHGWSAVGQCPVRGARHGGDLDDIDALYGAVFGNLNGVALLAFDSLDRDARLESGAANDHLPLKGGAKVRGVVHREALLRVRGWREREQKS